MDARAERNDVSPARCGAPRASAPEAYGLGARAMAFGDRGVKCYWLSCPAFTVEVEVNDSRIIQRAAPIAQRFVGQSLDLLLRWMGKYGTVECQAIVSSSNLFE